MLCALRRSIFALSSPCDDLLTNLFSSQFSLLQPYSLLSLRLSLLLLFPSCFLLYSLTSFSVRSLPSPT
ncbi:hypothetical protein L873DRAFT_662590 [Choiromyces venosus 120613-1]|uniref:Uncharacterized protein n=1 Tax=Choiromyces venosus 120613-1 TaxID=1336337 RepID=A0A3N4IUF0_9PEZI|nr:hypothetical protein L873DRAFT_662590 [Choiromyces venosus 120613-1]